MSEKKAKAKIKKNEELEISVRDPNKKAIIHAKELHHYYYSQSGETHALRDIDLCIYPGEFLSIVGPSGCGKTTLVSLISGLLEVQQGTIEYNCEDKTNPRDFCAYMLQKDELFEWRTVRKNILLPLEIKRMKTPENVKYAMDLAVKYGLGDFLDKKPRELSGGMRQRVALIRTIASHPKVLLLDEPFSALDFQTRMEVQQDVLNIIKNERMTAVLITHDVDEAVCMADVVAIMTKRPATIKEFLKTNHEENTTLIQRREKVKLSEWHSRIFEQKD